MKWLAKVALAWMPAAVKLRACREVSGDFAALLGRYLRRDGAQPVESYRDAARETGRRAAARLRRELGLGDTPEDAETAWRIVSNASGMKYTVERREGESVFHHQRCPLYDSGGAAMCADFCVPMVEGLTEGLCPSCRVRTEREATAGEGCAKALVWPRGGAGTTRDEA